MKDIYELLRQKGLQISTLEIEVEALRIVAPLLSDDSEVSNENQPSSSRRTKQSAPVRVPQAVNANPQPVHSDEWEDRRQQWP